jgi:hypothetical protein
MIKQQYTENQHAFQIASTKIGVRMLLLSLLALGIHRFGSHPIKIDDQKRGEQHKSRRKGFQPFICYGKVKINSREHHQ